MMLKNEDLNGYVRGAHQDGEEVCSGYEFHLPGSSSTPEQVVWGWNDIASFNCEKCKRPAIEHIVLKEPPPVKIQAEKKKAALPRPRPTGVAQADPTAADPSMETERRRRREAEQAAYFNAGYDPSGMLDDQNDPLAIAARPKPKPPPPPPPPPAAPPAPPAAPAHYAPPPPAASMPLAGAPPAAFTPSGADLADGVADPALQVRPAPRARQLPARQLPLRSR